MLKHFKIDYACNDKLFIFKVLLLLFGAKWLFSISHTGFQQQHFI